MTHAWSCSWPQLAAICSLLCCPVPSAHLAFHRRLRQSLLSHAGSGDDTNTASHIACASSSSLPLPSESMPLSDSDTNEAAG